MPARYSLRRWRGETRRRDHLRPDVDDLDVETGDRLVLVHNQHLWRSHRLHEQSSGSNPDHFGELALLNEGRRTSTVRALTTMRCFTIDGWDFRPIVKGNPDLSWGLLEGVAKQVVGAPEASVSE